MPDRLYSARTKIGLHAARPTVIVRTDRFAKNGAEVALVEWNQEVQTLTTGCPEQALTNDVRVWNANGRFEHRQTRRLERPIDAV